MEPREYAIVVPPSVQALGLPAAQTLLLSRIAALANGGKGCYASNEFLAGCCHCSARTVSRTLSRLKEKGLVIQLGFDGRRRRLKPVLPPPEDPARKNPAAPPGASLPEERKTALRERTAQEETTPEKSATAHPVCPDGSSRLPGQNGEKEIKKEKEKERSPLYPPEGGKRRRKRKGESLEFRSFDSEEFFEKALKKSREALLAGEALQARTTESSSTP